MVQRAEAVLLLRCIEVNGDWDAFFKWSDEQRLKQLLEGQVVQIRSKDPTQLPELDPDSQRRRPRLRQACCLSRLSRRSQTDCTLWKSVLGRRRTGLKTTGRKGANEGGVQGLE